MVNKNKVIQFPKKNNNEEFQQDEDDYDDFEGWETDLYYLNKKDYKSLLKYREEDLLKNPTDPYCQWLVGEAFILNKEYSIAIEVLGKILIEHPKLLDAKHSLLDALFATGKDENSFNWIDRPEVIRLSDNIGEKCYEFLKKKRKPRDISTLYCDLFICSGDYIKFDENELLHLLLEDDRFIVNGDATEFYNCEVTVKREKRKR